MSYVGHRLAFSGKVHHSACRMSADYQSASDKGKSLLKSEILKTNYNLKLRIIFPTDLFIYGVGSVPTLSFSK